MNNKKLGKIESAEFGYCEYMFGLHLTLSGNGWSVSAGIWYNPAYKNESVELYSIKMLDRVQKILKDAGVRSVSELKGKPIEASFDGNLLKDFRILTEVI
jgi:hypothetical protein